VKRRYFPLALVVLGLLLSTIGVASAALQTTNVLQAWDYGTTPQKYTNGNQVLELNSEPESFYTRLDFDNKPHADACGVGSADTTWAGDAFIDLYHTDNNPEGAQGFQSTGNWQIVKCSAFGAEPNDTTRLPAAGDVLAQCVPGNPGDGACVLKGPQDVVTACSSGNCQDTIVTNFHINTDLNCDGTQDEPFASVWQTGDLCLYWEAQKPAQPGWKGNFQVRYGASSGGDKTLNFSDTMLSANAVNISSLRAFADVDRVSLATLAGGMLLVATGLFIWRRNS
jgi:hypothetical protein